MNFRSASFIICNKYQHAGRDTAWHRFWQLISGKGSTGKTSLCAGVASCLAMEGQRVLCVDLDVGLRNLDIALGMADMAVLPFTSVMRGDTPFSRRHSTLRSEISPCSRPL
ncbi:MAG: AAA family ATPase [Acutalibacteraceae bacterium]